MNKFIVALFAMAVFFAPLSAQAVTDEEVLAITCNQMLKTETEAAFEKIFMWAAANADVTTEAEFMEIAEYLEEYCIANPNANFQEAMLAAQ